MKYTLAFDVYGTLINTAGIFNALSQLIPNEDTAKRVTDTWRNKQLEYSFRRGLMGSYVDFSIFTKDALQFCVEAYQLDFGEAEIDRLLEEYTVLPPFDDALAGITELKRAGHHLYAFSNGSTSAIKKLLTNAKIDTMFEGIVSMEGVKTFKPNPMGYRYFNEQSGSKKEASWLISSNSFDVIGAMAYGMHSAWVRRSTAHIFDPWGIEPTQVIGNLMELPKVLEKSGMK